MALVRIVGACALALAALRGFAADPSEYEVKAAFLYHFARYVEWPAEARERTFVITILGRDPFGTTIDRAVAGRSVGDRPVVVRRAASTAEARGSDIVFVGDSLRDRLADTLPVLAAAHALTVGETEDFAAQGGVVQFRMAGERVRLDINPDAAERAKLRISSELLKLARIVRPGRGRG